MRRLLIGITVGFAFVGLSAGVAVAQDGGAKVKEINFEDDTIEGELQMPNQTNITGMEASDLASLIKAREDFVDQLLKSVEDL